MVAPATHALVVFLAVTQGIQALLFERGEMAVGSWTDLFGISREGFFGGRLWQPLSSSFVASPPLEFLSSALTLYVVGRLYEAAFGSKALLATWLLGGVVGAVTSMLLPSEPLGGFGPANTAVLISLVARLPRLPVPTVAFTLPVQWIGFSLVLLESLRLLGDPTPRAATAALALVGGGSAGLLVGWVWPTVLAPRVRRQLERRERRRQVEDIERGLQEEPELDRLLDKIAREGLGSLSPVERRFLVRASNRYPSAPRS